MKKKATTNYKLEYDSMTWKDRCIELIKNEKLAFTDLFSPLKLTNGMIGLVAGYSESTIKNIKSKSERECMKIYKRLRRCDFGEFVNKSIVDNYKLAKKTKKVL